MHGFSTVDGFMEITECLAEMIKYVANEPSVGLFYVQQHVQNAVPNVIGLKNNVVEKSRETTLHTEDLEDSIAMVRSMKECGLPIANEMIGDITKSLAVMATKQPKKGLIHSSTSSFNTGRSGSWGPSSWGRSAVYTRRDVDRGGNYFSTVFKTAKQKASNFKWPQVDSKELIPTQDERLLSDPNLPQPVASASTSSSQPGAEADELPLSSQAVDEQLEEDPQVESSLPAQNVLSESENYDDFKADKEAKLEEWLEDTNGNVDNCRRLSGAGGI